MKWSLGSGASVYQFAQKRDARLAVPAALVTIIASLESPIVTLLLGNIFDALSEFTTGKKNSTDFMNKVLVSAAGIFSIGIATIVLSWWMLSLWCIFADHQIKRARRLVFKSLIHKDMKWFDEHTGVMGSLTMANRYVFFFSVCGIVRLNLTITN